MQLFQFLSCWNSTVSNMQGKSQQAQYATTSAWRPLFPCTGACQWRFMQQPGVKGCLIHFVVWECAFLTTGCYNLLQINKWDLPKFSDIGRCCVSIKVAAKSLHYNSSRQHRPQLKLQPPKFPSMGPAYLLFKIQRSLMVTWIAELQCWIKIDL